MIGTGAIKRNWPKTCLVHSQVLHQHYKGVNGLLCSLSLNSLHWLRPELAKEDRLASVKSTQRISRPCVMMETCNNCMYTLWSTPPKGKRFEFQTCACTAGRGAKKVIDLSLSRKGHVRETLASFLNYIPEYGFSFPWLRQIIHCLVPAQQRLFMIWLIMTWLLLPRCW